MIRNVIKGWTYICSRKGIAIEGFMTIAIGALIVFTIVAALLSIAPDVTVGSGIRWSIGIAWLALYLSLAHVRRWVVPVERLLANADRWVKEAASEGKADAERDSCKD